jgi:amino acid transporter
MVSIGAMIGAGIFVLTGLAVDISGPAAIVAFALDGGVTTFTALSYAELAAAIPRNGGGYTYVHEVFSAPVSFAMGWTRWFTYMIAGSLYALGFARTSSSGATFTASRSRVRRSATRSSPSPRW